jgi:hypothetical protein
MCGSVSSEISPGSTNTTYPVFIFESLFSGIQNSSNYYPSNLALVRLSVPSSITKTYCPMFCFCQMFALTSFMSV